jgi:4-hydroxy-tetrahydrodipicolinate synthase
MCGSDDQAVDYFFWGVRGWLAGTANVLPREHVEILEAASCGDHDRARSMFARLLPWLQHMEAGGYNQKAKLGLRHLGLDCGDVRPPLLPLGDEATAALVGVLDAARR